MASRTPSPRAHDSGLGHEPTTLGGRGWGTPTSSVQSSPSLRLAKICPSCLERYPSDFRVCPRDATELGDVAEEEEADPLLGATVGDTFSIVRAIGEGGMARVYEARHIRLPNKRFAVKVLHNMYAQQSNVVARFQREAEASSGIAHPNVVDVYDLGMTPDGRPFLVSEFLEGKDFATLLEERERIDYGVAVHVVRQVCRALTAAHGRGVVHRDVKPENVFLVGDMESPIVKVLDFGISKFDSGGGGASLTQTGMIMGTPGYMPPEQARGAKTDHRADIYGVGAMLYRAVTGRLPFDSDDATEALSMVLTEEPPRPRSIESSVPEALELVIQKAMAKDPADRYRSMAELDERLAPFDPETPSSVSLLPPSPVTRTSRKTTVASARERAPSIADDVEERGREAKLARPTILFLTLVAYVWLLGCFVDAGTSALAALRGVNGSTPTEKLVVGIVTVAISLAPAVFWLRYVRQVWGNSVRAVALSRTLRRLVLWAMVPYAFVALALRVALPLSDLRWAPMPAAVSLAVAMLGRLTAAFGRRRD